MTASTHRATMLSRLALLLLGCLSCAEAKGDTVEQLSLNEQLVNSADRINQQSCQADIHSVLREMTAVMTEQRVQLQNTMDRLKDSEALIKALQVEQSSTQQELQQTQQELRTATERLTDSDSLIKASVETIDARSNATQHEVQFLQKHNEVSRVSFSAGLLTTEGGTSIGPYNVATILKYRHVFTNVGNGYNRDTGFFTAPVRGIYQFNIFVFGYGANHPSAAKLIKNGQHVVLAYGTQPSHTYTSSNGASLLLETGDVVYVELWGNSWIHDNYNHHNTFSGHLLFTM